MSVERGPSKSEDSLFRQVVYGVAAAATMTYLGWLGAQVTTINNRLTRIETTMDENKAERQAQVDDLRSRLGRMEITVYRNGRGE